MAKATKDILERLVDLHHQATVERSHYYAGRVIQEAMWEIAALRIKLAGMAQLAQFRGMKGNQNKVIS